MNAVWDCAGYVMSHVTESQGHRAENVPAPYTHDIYIWITSYKRNIKHTKHY